MFAIKRAYEAPSPEDGQRVLVDRLWPRGLSRESARIDRWMRDIAPSDALRKWFGHDPGRWEDFRTRYRTELRNMISALAPLLEAGSQGKVTLVYGTRDALRNNAAVLKDLLEELV